MADEVLHVLCALAAFCIPMGFAWFMVSRTTRHARRQRRTDDAMK